MKLVFTPEAEEQANECDLWWREHRDARDLFARELAATRTVLREIPNIGTMYTVLDGLPVRRVLMRKTKAHVYYAVDDAAELVEGPGRVGCAKGPRPQPSEAS